MGRKTDQYLGGLAADSFKREIDADENIWRSLPFFAAAFALAFNFIPDVVKNAPAWTVVPWPFIVNSLIALSIASFLWAFRWFWSVVRPRDYQYPPNDLALKTYATQLEQFYEVVSLSDEELDATVAREMEIYMNEQLASASTRNRENNIGKAQARSQALLFLMIGFGLAFLSEATILTGNAWRQTPRADRLKGKNDGRPAEATNLTTTEAANSASADDGKRRGEVNSPAGIAQKLGNQKVSDGKTPPPVSRPSPPPPPPPQIVKRSDPPPPGAGTR